MSTFNELSSKLREAGVRNQHIGDYFRDSEYYNRPADHQYPPTLSPEMTVLRDVLGPVIEVDRYGGEGEGETYWIVGKLPKHNDMLVRMDGYYQSYDGVDWNNGNGFEEVAAETKTVTVYETINY